tara:strand:- start:25494 stop:26126 length:633 start_codon:yes stop_codon:yes gene_type:complete
MDFVSYYTEGLDSTNKVVVTYGGRFHPPHKGHIFAYEYLRDEFAGHDAFITTSNKVDPPNSPFTFDEKNKLFQAAGISPGVIYQVRNNYSPVEILDSYDKESTIYVTGISKKDMEDNPRFTFKPKRDGSPAYLQEFKSIEECRPMSEHGYIFTIPTIEFDMSGVSFNSASEIRKLYIGSDEHARIALLKALYPSYNDEVYNIFNRALLND